MPTIIKDTILLRCSLFKSCKFTKVCLKTVDYIGSSVLKPSMFQRQVELRIISWSSVPKKDTSEKMRDTVFEDSSGVLYTVSQKKQDTKLFHITSPNINRFSKFSLLDSVGNL